MDQIVDLSDLCRLCLEPGSSSVPLSSRPGYSKHTVAELIRFCLDVNCNVKDNGILPQTVCQICQEKLRVSFELKTKSKESDKYLQTILTQTSGEPENDEEFDLLTPYNPTSSFHPPDDDEESLLQPVEDRDAEYKSNGSSGAYTCNVCGKNFKYIKPYKKHLKLHAVQKSTQKSKKQAPYDSRSPYESPAPYAVSPVRRSSTESAAEFPKGERVGDFECTTCLKKFKYIKAYTNHLKQHSTSPGSPPKKQRLMLSSSLRESARESARERDRDSSPDFAMMVMSTSFQDPEEQPSNKRTRTRKQVLPSRSPSKEPSPEITEAKPKVVNRGGRPRKHPIQETVVAHESTPDNGEPKKGRGRPRKYPRAEAAEEEEEMPLGLEGFCEVDLSKVLKSKNIFADDSVSQSGPSTSHSRSRSASVELVQEFDIFGGPDHDVLASPQKSGFGSGTTFSCDIDDCNKKFHLRANLKKHRREAHAVM